MLGIGKFIGTAARWIGRATRFAPVLSTASSLIGTVDNIVPGEVVKKLGSALENKPLKSLLGLGIGAALLFILPPAGAALVGAAADLISASSEQNPAAAQAALLGASSAPIPERPRESQIHHHCLAA